MEAAEAKESDNDNWKMSFDDGVIVEFDPALFCHNLQSLTFVIYPKAAQNEKGNDSLKNIIQGNGGIVLKEPDNYSITVLDLTFMDRHGLEVPEKKDWAHDLFSSRFIYESIRYGKIGDLNDYLLDSVYEDYNANDILFKESGWSDLVLRVEEEEVADNKNRNKKSTKSPSRSEGHRSRRSEKENGPGRNLKSLNNTVQDDVEENDYDEESLVVDPPIISAEKVKRVRLDDMGLPLLPKRPYNIGKSKENRAQLPPRPPTASGTSQQKVPAKVVLQKDAQSIKTPTAANMRTPTKTAPEIVLRKSPRRVPIANNNTEPCSSRQARERDQRGRNQTSVVPLTPTSDQPSPRRARDSSPESVFELSESEHEEEEQQGRPLARSVSPIDDINPPPARREANGQASRSGFLARRTPYSTEEDRKIMEQIIKYKWYAHYGGNIIWQWMEQNTELNFGRTYQSLKNRFRSHILPNRQKFRLTPDQLKSFQKGMASVRKGYKIKAILPPLP